MRFMTKAFVDAMAPSQLRADQPAGARAGDGDQGREPAQGPRAYARATWSKGQLTHVDSRARSRSAATSRRRRARWSSRRALYQLIQYAPATDKVLATPLIIFPPWINRFYILDLNPKKSFIKWAVDQGLTVFVVSWKSADESMADVDARRLCPRPGRGDRRGARGARRRGGARDRLLRRRARCWRRPWPCSRRAGEADKVATATFFTAQVDFSEARRPQAVHRRRADGADPPAFRRQGLSRRPLHGGDLQPAARPRPDLELRHQQLPDGRGLSAVRPALLERRHDQFAGRLAPRLSPAALPREQAGPAGRDQGRRRCRSTSGR